MVLTKPRSKSLHSLHNLRLFHRDRSDWTKQIRQLRSSLKGSSVRSGVAREQRTRPCERSDGKEKVGVKDKTRWHLCYQQPTLPARRAGNHQPATAFRHGYLSSKWRVLCSAFGRASFSAIHIYLQHATFPRLSPHSRTDRDGIKSFIHQLDGRAKDEIGAKSLSLQPPFYA